MDPVEKWLEQLDQEKAVLTAERKAAKVDWLSAKDPQQDAKLKEVCEDAKRAEERIDLRRAELKAKLRSSGELMA